MIHRKDFLVFVLGLAAGAVIALVFVFLLIGWQNLSWIALKQFYRPDRLLDARSLEFVRQSLLEYQVKFDCLPTLSEEEFDREYAPHSATPGSEMSTEYANDRSLRFGSDQPERAVVVLKVFARNQQSIHILTSQSHLIQSVNFDFELWGTKLAGRPIPYDKLRSYVWTNLNER